MLGCRAFIEAHLDPACSASASSTPGRCSTPPRRRALDARYEVAVVPRCLPTGHAARRRGAAAPRAPGPHRGWALAEACAYIAEADRPGGRPHRSQRRDRAPPRRAATERPPAETDRRAARRSPTVLRMAEPTVRILRDDERAEASRVVNIRHAGLRHRRGQRGLGGAHRGRAGRTAPSPRPASSWGWRGTSPPTSPCPAVATWPRLASPRWRCSPPTGVRATSPGSCGRQLAASLTNGSRSPSSSRPSGPSTAASGTAPPIDACRFEIDAATARFRHPATGSIELVDPTELRPHLEAAHEARRAAHPGGHPAGTDGVGAHRRRLVAGRARPSTPACSAARCGVTTTGAVQGAVAYKVDDAWTRNRPTGRAEVRLLVGANAGGRARALAPPLRDRLGADRQRRQPGRRRPAGPASSGRPGRGRPRPVRLHLGAHPRRPRRPRRLVGPTGRPKRWSRSPMTSGFADRALEHRPRARRGRGHARPTATADVALPAGRARRHVPRRALGRPPPRGRMARRGHPGGRARLDATLRTATAPWSPTTY